MFERTEDYLGVDEYDVATQQMWSHHHRFDGADGHRDSIPFRYVWPSELDLMARLAGMRLAHRWADWDRTPFTADSTSHVSVWQLAQPVVEEGASATVSKPGDGAAPTGSRAL